MDKVMPKISIYAIPIIAPLISRRIPFSHELTLAVLRKIAKLYGISVQDIMGSRRTEEIVYARHLFCYWMRDIFGIEATYKYLGSVLNGRDHTTIIHSVQTYSNMLEINTILKFLPRINGTGTRFTRTIEDYTKTQKQLLLCLSEFLEKSAQAKTLLPC